MSDSPSTAPRNPIQLLALVHFLQQENEHLKLLVAKLQRMQFGRRSERFEANEAQGSLFPGQDEAASESAPSADPKDTVGFSTASTVGVATRKPT